jgi:hypothetical protein
MYFKIFIYTYFYNLFIKKDIDYVLTIIPFDVYLYYHTIINI